jgi:hypothetical protein
MMRQKQGPMVQAAIAALREIANDAVAEGRQNIASSGHFGRNWQRDLQFRMEGEGIETKAIVFHKSALAIIFETGITITGKPLLWIPTRPHMPSPGILVRRRGVKLTSATVHGTPMLFNAADRDPHRKPLYIGVPSVHIGKKWRITEIVKKHVERFAALFRKHDP